MTGMPQEVYFELLRTIEYSATNDMDELNNFVRHIPIKLKTKIIMLAYRSTYEKINFL